VIVAADGTISSVTRVNPSFGPYFRKAQYPSRARGVTSPDNGMATKLITRIFGGTRFRHLDARYNSGLLTATKIRSVSVSCVIVRSTLPSDASRSALIRRQKRSAGFLFSARRPHASSAGVRSHQRSSSSRPSPTDDAPGTAAGAPGRARPVSLSTQLSSLAGQCDECKSNQRPPEIESENLA
jgi:hypothetical protein